MCWLHVNIDILRRFSTNVDFWSNGECLPSHDLISYPPDIYRRHRRFFQLTFRLFYVVLPKHYDCYIQDGILYTPNLQKSLKLICVPSDNICIHTTCLTSLPARSGIPFECYVSFLLMTGFAFNNCSWSLRSFVNESLSRIFVAPRFLALKYRVYLVPIHLPSPHKFLSKQYKKCESNAHSNVLHKNQQY